jgi:stress-induced morphogen
MMARARGRRRNREVELIEETLSGEYPRSEAYRYNSASIRIRIIDDRFRGKSKAEREEMVFPVLKRLPEEIQDDIMLLLLLTDDELDLSLLNVEFENPIPSRL